MMENIPGKHVKVVVLEGSLRLSINGRLGEAMTLTAGKMVIVGAKDRSLPKPVTVDLRKMIKTAALIDPDKFRGTAKIKVDPLPSMGLIEKEIALQSMAKAGAQLAETNLLIEGDGTDVVIASRETMAALDSATEAVTTAVASVTAPVNDRANIIPSNPLVPKLPTEVGLVTLPDLDLPLPGGGVVLPTSPDPGSGTPLPPTLPDPGTITSPLDPVVPPVVVAIDAPVVTGSGTFTTAPTADVSVATDIVAADVSLEDVGNDLQVSGSVTADTLTFDAGNTVEFEAEVQANVITGVGDLITFSEPIGAASVSLDATVLKAVSINATTSILLTGQLQALPSKDILLRAPLITIGGGINVSGAGNSLLPLLGGAPGAGGVVVIESDSVLIDSAPGGIAGIKANGGNATLTSLSGGGSGGAVYLGTDANPISGDVVIKKDISATTGSSATFLQRGGTGGTVSAVANGAIDVQAKITVSDTSSGSGGRVRLESRKVSGTAINVSNSSQIASILSAGAPGPGGKIEFVSAGGDIAVSGSTVRADKGTVDLRNNGAGNITLTNATLRGDVVKANVLGANGQLIIGGGSIDANSAIKLYASGANGTVLFNDNVALNGNSVKTIAGNTVTINNGKVVTINGTNVANVYTNNANYTGSGGNGATSGRFGGKGAVTKPFAQRPTF
jgi:hypothetical protein